VRGRLDLVTGQSRPLAELGVPSAAASVSGDVAVTIDNQGALRVGRVSGGSVHWLVGHDKPVQEVAISPDLRWVASTSEDDTLRLWPMPDLSKPALHELTREALIAKLRSLTNLTAVRSRADPFGWKIEIDPFPGWKDVPTW
jgi:WD40 repeat protein